MNRRQLLQTGATAGLAALLPAGLAAQHTASPQAGSFPDLTIRVTDTGFDIPRELESGRYAVSVENTGSSPFHAALGRLPDGATLEELSPFLMMESEEMPEWFPQTGFVGLPDWTQPGERRTGVIDLQAGSYFMFDPFSMALAPLTMTGEGDFSAEPESDLTVEMREMAFVVPQGGLTVEPARLKIVNTGQLPHELHVLAVPEATTAEHFQEIFALGEDATPSPDNPLTPFLGEYAPVAAISMLGSERTCWIDVDLAPRTYALICTVPYPSGIPHAMEGMIEIVTLAER